MRGTKGPRFAVALFLLLAAAPVLAAPPALIPIPRAAWSLTALGAVRELEALGAALQGHLAGRRAPLEDLDRRLRRIDAGLADGSVPEGEAARLRPAAARLRQLLADAGGPRPATAARPPAWTRSPSPYRAPVGGSGDTLLAAAGGPAAAGRLFDASRSRGRGDAAPAVPAGARYREAPVAAPAPAPPRRRTTVPPSPVGPGASPPAVASPPAGRQPAGSPPAADGVVFLSPRIARLRGASGFLYETGVADLLREEGAQGRTALSRDVARQVLAATGKAGPAGKRALALGNFLRDIADYKPAGAASARLEADEAGRLRLIFELSGGGRRILAGEFLPASRGGGEAFVVMGAVEVGPAGEVRQDHAGYWREYTEGDRRLEWSSTTESRAKGWALWKHADEVRSSWLSEQDWKGGRCVESEKDKVKSVTAKEGKTWLGRAGDAVMKAPVIGKALKFCDDTAATLYTGIIAAPSVFIGAATGADWASLEAGGSYAKNPLMKKAVGEQGFLERLTPGARAKLDDKVRETRESAIERQPYPVPPEARRSTVEAPIGAKESVAVLAESYGAGSYGKRLIRAGYEREGWQRNALVAAGVVTGVAETLGEGVCNPIFWATLGAGELVAAAKGSAALASGATGAKAALAGAKALELGAQAAWWGPWLLTGADNAGRLVQLTADGSFDKDYWKRVSEGGADGMFLLVVP